MRKHAAILSAVLLVACGGGTAASTSDTINPAVRDQLAADAAVLQVSDLPDLFAAHSSSSSQDTPVSRNPSECLDPATGQNSNASDDLVAAAQREFAIGFRLDAIIVRGVIQIYRDPAAPTAKLGAFGQSGVTECLKKLYVEQLTAVGGTVGDVSVTPSKVEGVGDEQSGFVLSFLVTIDGVDHPFAAEFDFTRVGRAGLTVSVFSPRGLDHSLAVTAMTAMINRFEQQ
jgi:hypothetical protein